MDEELEIHESLVDEIPAIEGEAEFGQSYHSGEPPEYEAPSEESHPKDPDQPMGPNYFEFFTNLFVEVYDVQSGFEQATENYTKVLLERGLEINPQELYSQVQLMARRYMKLAMVKRLCHAMGLSGEMDKILEREMDLVYNSNRSSDKAPPGPNVVAAGEADR